MAATALILRLKTKTFDNISVKFQQNLKKKKKNNRGWSEIINS